MHPPIISLFKRSTTAEIIEIIIEIIFLEPRRTYYLKESDRLDMVVELKVQNCRDIFEDSL